MQIDHPIERLFWGRAAAFIALEDFPIKFR